MVGWLLYSLVRVLLDVITTSHGDQARRSSVAVGSGLPLLAIGSALAPAEIRGSAFGLLAAIQGYGNLGIVAAIRSNASSTSV